MPNSRRRPWPREGLSSAAGVEVGASRDSGAHTRREKFKSTSGEVLGSMHITQYTKGSSHLVVVVRSACPVATCPTRSGEMDGHGEGDMTRGGGTHEAAYMYKELCRYAGPMGSLSLSSSDFPETSSVTCACKAALRPHPRAGHVLRRTLVRNRREMSSVVTIPGTSTPNREYRRVKIRAYACRECSRRRSRSRQLPTSVV